MAIGRKWFTCHYGNDGRAAVAGPADRLRPDQRRRSLAVVVADVDAEADFRPVATASDRVREHIQHVPQPTSFVLADDTRRDGNAALPGGPGQGHGVADAGLAGDGGNVGEHAVADRVGAGVAVNVVG
jgi:hypothetical protein